MSATSPVALGTRQRGSNAARKSTPIMQLALAAVMGCAIGALFISVLKLQRGAQSAGGWSAAASDRNGRPAAIIAQRGIRDASNLHHHRRRRHHHRWSSPPPDPPFYEMLLSSPPPPHLPSEGLVYDADVGMDGSVSGQTEAGASSHESCSQMAAEHGVVPHHSWGTLPSEGQALWQALDCDHEVLPTDGGDSSESSSDGGGGGGGGGGGSSANTDEDSNGFVDSHGFVFRSSSRKSRHSRDVGDRDAVRSNSTRGVHMTAAARREQLGRRRRRRIAAAKLAAAGLADVVGSVSSGRGSASEQCARMREQHGVRPGTSWGSLSPLGQRRWVRLQCDKMDPEQERKRQTEATYLSEYSMRLKAALAARPPERRISRPNGGATARRPQTPGNGTAAAAAATAVVPRADATGTETVGKKTVVSVCVCTTSRHTDATELGQLALFSIMLPSLRDSLAPRRNVASGTWSVPTRSGGGATLGARLRSWFAAATAPTNGRAGTAEVEAPDVSAEGAGGNATVSDVNMNMSRAAAEDPPRSASASGEQAAEKEGTPEEEEEDAREQDAKEEDAKEEDAKEEDAKEEDARGVDARGVDAKEEDADAGPAFAGTSSATAAAMAAAASADHPGAYEFWLYVLYDAGDAFFDSAQREAEVSLWIDRNVVAPLAAVGVTLRFAILRFDNVLRKPGPAFNFMMKAAMDDGADYLYRVNDDTQFVGQGWAAQAVGALRSYDPPNVGVVGPVCHEGNTRILTHDLVHRTHLDIFEHYYPPIFSDWWMDDWITHVYGPGRTRRGPFQVHHRIGHQGTRYEVDQSHEQKLQSELQAGRMTIERWLLQRDAA